MGMAKRSGPETANCRSTERRDVHADIIDTDQGDPRDHRQGAVIVEITPWFAENRTDWSHTNAWQHASYHGGYSGTNHGTPERVRIYGFLFYDNPHAGDGLVGTTRGTAWEVHPITRIEVLLNGSWTEIQ